MNIAGKPTLFIRFETFVVKCDFLLIEQLATAYVLRGDLLYRFFNSIKQRKRVVELDDAT